MSSRFKVKSNGKILKVSHLYKLQQLLMYSGY